MNIVITGRRLEGKTTLAIYLARRRHKAIVIYDPRGMVDGIKVYSPDELEEAINEGAWRNGPIVYRFDGDSVQHFEELCEVLFPPFFTRGGFALIVDESQMLQSPHKMNPALDRAIKQHPTDGGGSVTIIQTTHRLTNIHNDMKTIMDELFMFRSVNPKDLELTADFTDDEVARIVKDLPIHHCVRYEYARKVDGVQYEIWDDPSVWYTPLGHQMGGGEIIIQEEPTEEMVEKRKKQWKGIGA